MKKLKCIIDERGYALIEVVFLMAVIAILSATVIPKIGEGMKTAQADYLMKSLYSELRFMQTAKRITPDNKENVLGVYKQTTSFVVISSNENKQYRIRFSNNEEFRKYKLPPNLSFKEDFSIKIIDEGLVSNSKSNNKYSGSIVLIDNFNKQYKPFIVFDSVGRIRFADSNNNT